MRNLALLPTICLFICSSTVCLGSYFRVANSYPGEKCSHPSKVQCLCIVLFVFSFTVSGQHTVSQSYLCHLFLNPSVWLCHSFLMQLVCIPLRAPWFQALSIKKTILHQVKFTLCGVQFHIFHRCIASPQYYTTVLSPLNSLVLPFLLSQPPDNYRALLFIPRVLPTSQCHINGLIQYIAFGFCFFHWTKFI